MTSAIVSKPLVQDQPLKTQQGLAWTLGLLIMLAALILGSPLKAMDAETAKVLDVISKDLNGNKTMNGEFIQTAPNGDTLQGYFFIERPGKIRFYYSKPSYTDIIADGKTLSIEDRRLKTQDIYPLSKTPLKVLLSEKLDLAHDRRVKNASVAEDIVSVTVEQESLIGDSLLTLIFERKNSLLRQWTITDSRGAETTVTVFNVEVGRPIKQSLFKIKYQVHEKP